MLQGSAPLLEALDPSGHIGKGSKPRVRIALLHVWRDVGAVEGARPLQKGRTCYQADEKRKEGQGIRNDIGQSAVSEYAAMVRPNAIFWQHGAREMFCHTCGIRNPGGRTTVREEAQRHAGNRIEGTRAETPNTAGAGTCAGSDALDGDPMLANARGGIFDTGAVRLGSGRCAALFRTQPNAACSPPVVRKNPCVFSLRWRAGRVGRRCLWCLRRSAALVGILAAGRLGELGKAPKPQGFAWFFAMVPRSI